MVATALVSAGRGILAADESLAAASEPLEAVDGAPSADTRRERLLLTTPGTATVPQAVPPIDDTRDELAASCRHARGASSTGLGLRGNPGTAAPGAAADRRTIARSAGERPDPAQRRSRSVAHIPREADQPCVKSVRH